MATSTKSRVANPIAVRRYAVAGEPGRQVVLTLGKPRRDPQQGGDWMCSVLIEGVPQQRRRRIHGIDAIQALQLAMLYARHRLDATKLPLTWLDGEPGDIGLPLSAPTGWGLDFQRRLERYLRREEIRLARAITAAAKHREHRAGREAGKRREDP